MTTKTTTALLASLAMFLLLPAAASAAPTISSLAPVKVVAGGETTVRGAVEPAAANEQVQVEQHVNGSWRAVGAPVTTDVAGAWSARFAPRVGGAVRAVQLTGEGGISTEPVVVGVAARLISSGVADRDRVYPFLGARATWRVAGGYPNGRVRVELRVNGKSAGVVRTTIRAQRVAVKLPTNGVGRFEARLVLPARGGLLTTTFAPVRFTVRGERVGPGSSATWNRSLRAALRYRGVHVPGGSSFDSRMGESVIAFHKAYNRARTTTFEASDWQRLAAAPIRVKEGRRRGLHIEVDKSRQILMHVKDGRAVMVVHVSTGRSGNTPPGRHKIQWKGNWVPSLFNSMLYKSMAFRGAFAIHGYPSVPTSPASAGCVRVPMWIAAKLYERSPVGTPVIVYEKLGRGSGRAASAAVDVADVPELTGVDPARWADEIA